MALYKKNPTFHKHLKIGYIQATSVSFTIELYFFPLSFITLMLLESWGPLNSYVNHKLYSP